MKKTSALVLTLAAALGLASSAAAKPEKGSLCPIWQCGFNGVELNGMRMNGVELNGLGLNGINLNGWTLNGVELNDWKLNGLQLNDFRMNGLGLNGMRMNGLELNARVLNGVSVNAPAASDRNIRIAPITACKDESCRPGVRSVKLPSGERIAVR